MKRVYSAGGVVYKIDNYKPYFLLISTKHGEVWTLPKGLIERDESSEEAAIREIKEETGIEGKIIDHLGKTSYWFNFDNERYFKTVTYFLVEYVKGEINPDFEVDTASWFSYDEALRRLKYKSDIEMLKKAMERLIGTHTVKA